MKLTKQQLKQLIKEELQNALQEAAPLRKIHRHPRPRPSSEGSLEPLRRSSMVQAAKNLAAWKEDREITLNDIFAELQEIKALLSREMTPAGLGIEGAPQ